jgi:hypothetical protein
VRPTPENSHRRVLFYHVIGIAGRARCYFSQLIVAYQICIRNRKNGERFNLTYAVTQALASTLFVRSQGIRARKQWLVDSFGARMSITRFKSAAPTICGVALSPGSFGNSAESFFRWTMRDGMIQYLLLRLECTLLETHWFACRR